MSFPKTGRRQSRQVAIIRGRAGAFLMAVAVASCATTPADCDPRADRHLGEAMSCLTTGGYEAFLDEYRAEYERLLQEIELNRTEARLLNIEARRFSEDEAAYRTRLTELQSDLADERSALDSIIAGTDRKRAKKAVALAELEKLERDVNQASQNLQAKETEIAEKQENFALRRKAIGALYQEVRVE